MAKGFANTDAQCRRIMDDVRKGIFSPVYLLMGKEPYYPDLVCNAIIDNKDIIHIRSMASCESSA